MGEKGILKLLHPGRFAEIHWEPIPASEVMKKNPRHVITRPDVFEFPWIVINPDSVLVLGRVYLIVPNHTIHGLLKEYAHRNRVLDRKGPGMDKLCWDVNQAEPWTQVGEKFRNSNTHLEFDQNQPDFFTTQRIFGIGDVDGVEMIGRRLQGGSGEDGGLEVEHGQTGILKSCLRRKDSARNLLGFRVSFVLPESDWEPKRVRVSEDEFPLMFNWEALTKPRLSS